jgi:hypothetical protein
VWPFFKHGKKNSREGRRALDLEDLRKSLEDYSDLEIHDASVKFWLPSPAADALKEVKMIRSESINEILLIFLLGHCYGFYFQQVLLNKHPEVYRDDEPDIRFSLRQPREGEQLTEQIQRIKREVIYFVPELGKNVFPIKLWLPQRLKTDIALLADHAGLTLSGYLREIVISRLFGHGMLPMRPEMLEVAETSIADAWCEDETVPWTQVSREIYDASMAGRSETIEIPDDGDLHHQ